MERNADVMYVLMEHTVQQGKSEDRVGYPVIQVRRIKGNVEIHQTKRKGEKFYAQRK